MARVRANQAEWEALGIEGRYHWLGKLRDWMLDNLEQISDTMQAETGKVRGDISSELFYVTDLINFYGRKADEVHRRGNRPAALALLVASKKLVIQYRPHPVVGVISPWNFPLSMALGDSIPALQAGAAVVVKPSEFTPLSLIEVIEAWKKEIGAPDVFDCVLGTGEAGGALVDEVDFVQFTGSDRTGRKVMARAAETLTPVSLELGGKDPMIVLADADVDRAANAAAWGGMFNSGQVCISVERIYVEEPVYDEFVAKLTKKVGDLRQGPDGRTPEKDVGAMTSPNQRSVIEDHVNDALANGARALTGGKAGRRSRRLLRADRPRRRRPLDEGDARRDLRPRRRGDEGARLRGGAAPRQRHPLRARRLGLRREEPRRERRPPDRGRLGQRQRRDRQHAGDRTCRWAAGSSPGSASATASTGSRSTAARSRSSSPASAASANRPGTRTRSPAAAWSTAPARRSTPATWKRRLGRRG